MSWGKPTGLGNGDCPTAYGGCRCHCHQTPGVKHVMPCCYPSDDGDVIPHLEEELWGKEKEKEKETVDDILKRMRSRRRKENE